MMRAAPSEAYFIGWDVGGWNCDKNGKSRDAIVILDSMRNPVGEPWRGNLRAAINEAASTDEWIEKLFHLCQAPAPGNLVPVTLAIDTPLGFSEELVRLVTGQAHVPTIGHSASNPYLFRKTELHLFGRQLTPLSSIKDMIGSQATKGMHVLAKFAPQIESCGVWTDGGRFRAIETYPTACRKTDIIQSMRNDVLPAKHADLNDAHTCALMACLFATDRKVLEQPSLDVPISEGWIWYPVSNDLKAKLSGRTGLP